MVTFSHPYHGLSPSLVGVAPPFFSDRAFFLIHQESPDRSSWVLSSGALCRGPLAPTSDLTVEVAALFSLYVIKVLRFFLVDLFVE